MNTSHVRRRKPVNPLIDDEAEDDDGDIDDVGDGLDGSDDAADEDDDDGENVQEKVAKKCVVSVFVGVTFPAYSFTADSPMLFQIRPSSFVQFKEESTFASNKRVIVAGVVVTIIFISAGKWLYTLNFSHC